MLVAQSRRALHYRNACMYRSDWVAWPRSLAEVSGSALSKYTLLAGAQRIATVADIACAAAGVPLVSIAHA